MAGRVCVFNCFNESINQISVGGLRRRRHCGMGRQRRRHVPAPVDCAAAHQARRRADRPAVRVGDNPCQVAWDSWLVTVNVTVPSPGSVSLDDDLLLYVFVNQSVLVSTRGMVLGTFSNASGRNLA